MGIEGAHGHEVTMKKSVNDGPPNNVNPTTKLRAEASPFVPRGRKPAVAPVVNFAPTPLGFVRNADGGLDFDVRGGPVRPVADKPKGVKVIPKKLYVDAVRKHTDKTRPRGSGSRPLRTERPAVGIKPVPQTTTTATTMTTTTTTKADVHVTQADDPNPASKPGDWQQATGRRACKERVDNKQDENEQEIEEEDYDEEEKDATATNIPSADLRSKKKKNRNKKDGPNEPASSTEEPKRKKSQTNKATIPVTKPTEDDFDFEPIPTTWWQTVLTVVLTVVAVCAKHTVSSVCSTSKRMTPSRSVTVGVLLYLAFVDGPIMHVAAETAGVSVHGHHAKSAGHAQKHGVKHHGKHDANEGSLQSLQKEHAKDPDADQEEHHSLKKGVHAKHHKTHHKKHDKAVLEPVAMAAADEQRHKEVLSAEEEDFGSSSQGGAEEGKAGPPGPPGPAGPPGPSGDRRDSPPATRKEEQQQPPPPPPPPAIGKRKAHAAAPPRSAARDKNPTNVTAMQPARLAEGNAATASVASPPGAQDSSLSSSEDDIAPGTNVPPPLVATPTWDGDVKEFGECLEKYQEFSKDAVGCPKMKETGVSVYFAGVMQEGFVQLSLGYAEGKGRIGLIYEGMGASDVTDSMSPLVRYVIQAAKTSLGYQCAPAGSECKNSMVPRGEIDHSIGVSRDCPLKVLGLMQGQEGDSEHYGAMKADAAKFATAYKSNDASYFKAGSREYAGAVIACHAVRFDGKGANETRTESTLGMYNEPQDASALSDAFKDLEEVPGILPSTRGTQKTHGCEPLEGDLDKEFELIEAMYAELQDAKKALLERKRYQIFQKLRSHGKKVARAALATTMDTIAPGLSAILLAPLLKKTVDVKLAIGKFAHLYKAASENAKGFREAFEETERFANPKVCEELQKLRQGEFNGFKVPVPQELTNFTAQAGQELQGVIGALEAIHPAVSALIGSLSVIIQIGMIVGEGATARSNRKLNAARPFIVVAKKLDALVQCVTETIATRANDDKRIGRLTEMKEDEIDYLLEFVAEKLKANKGVRLKGDIEFDLCNHNKCPNPFTQTWETVYYYKRSKPQAPAIRKEVVTFCPDLYEEED